MKVTVRNMKAGRGFTLLEVICVLVILGVLAAIAVPRYVYLIEQAKIKTIENTLASACVHVSLVFAREILSDGMAPSMASLSHMLNDEEAEFTAIGDFTVEYEAFGTGGITVRLTGSSAFAIPAEGGPFEKTIVIVPDGS